jgi:hypothetical protein
MNQEIKQVVKSQIVLTNGEPVECVLLGKRNNTFYFATTSACEGVLVMGTAMEVADRPGVLQPRTIVYYMHMVSQYERIRSLVVGEMNLTERALQFLNAHFIQPYIEQNPDKAAAKQNPMAAIELFV